MPKAIGVDPPDFKPHYRILDRQDDRVAQIRQVQDLPAGKVLKLEGTQLTAGKKHDAGRYGSGKTMLQINASPAKLHNHVRRKCPSSMEQPPLMEPHP